MHFIFISLVSSSFVSYSLDSNIYSGKYPTPNDDELVVEVEDSDDELAFLDDDKKQADAPRGLEQATALRQSH